jgi:hypothetical protein
MVTGTVIEPYLGRKAFGAWLDLGDNALGLIRTPELRGAVPGAAAASPRLPESGQTLVGRVISHRVHFIVELSAEQLTLD